MTFPQQTYHSKTYREFKEIDAGDYRTIARYFEEHEREIGRLEFEEYFELRVCYAAALFEIGAYERHLQQVDFILETSIQQNIQFFQGEDLFCKTLFQKAASHFNLLNFEQAEYILCELIKINPYYPDVGLFLQKTRYQSNPKLILATRATAIAAFLLSGLVIFIELVFVQPWYDEYIPAVRWLRNGIFLAGLFVLFGGDVLVRLQIRRQAYRLLQRAKEKRRSNYNCPP